MFYLTMKLSLIGCDLISYTLLSWNQDKFTLTALFKLKELNGRQIFFLTKGPKLNLLQTKKNRDGPSQIMRLIYYSIIFIFKTLHMDLIHSAVIVFTLSVHKNI